MRCAFALTAVTAYARIHEDIAGLMTSLHIWCSFFSKYSEMDYARSGMPATQDVVIPAGPLNFQHTMVDQLRKLGLPVMLKTGASLNSYANTPPLD